MANSNFVVQNGLTVGPTTISAASGNITIPVGRHITIGNVLLRDNGQGRLAVRDITDNSDAIIDATVDAGSTTSGNIQIGTNHIESTNANGPISLRPNGTGNVALAANTIMLGKGGSFTLVSTGEQTDPLYGINYTPSNIIVQTTGALSSGNVRVSMTTAATSVSTGAFQVSGGVGVVGAVLAGQFNTSGNLLSTGLRVFGNTSIGLTGAVSGQFHTVVGNITQSTSGGVVYINTSGNVMASIGQFGSINSTGFINTTANVSGAVVLGGTMTTTGTLTAAIVNSTGNILGTGGVLNSLTVNGGITSTGFINTSGNVSGAVVNAGALNVSGTSTVAAVNSTGFINTTGNLSVGGNVLMGSNVTLGRVGPVSGAWHNIVGNVNQVTSGGAVNFTTGGNISATAGWVSAGTLNVTGNVLAGAGTFNGISFTGDIVPQANNASALGSVSNRLSTVFAVNINGLSVNANYADLAENYLADAAYIPGTVLMFGGDQEVTECTHDMCSRVAGVVSTNPAYLMNSGLEGEHTVKLALTGRVPTRVRGPVRKGDLMVSAGDGHARAETLPRVGTVIGKALEDFTGDTGVIEVVVGKH